MTDSITSNMLSIIVPTYKEALNIPLLTAEITASLEGHELTYEIIFVDDDSPDNTIEICKQLECDFPVSLITRKNIRGLSSAVLQGFSSARGNVLLVMDCDLSHPATAIPAMVNALTTEKADFVVGSRYVDGSSTHDNWGWFRHLNSMIPSYLSKPLSPIKDPMSGFFAFHRKQLPDSSILSPIGYKIGLEIFVKGDFHKPMEVPIHFSERLHGESKLSLLEQLRFLRHLRRLYHFHYPVVSEFFQFGLVGASGFIVDIIFYYLLQLLLGFEHTVARGISFIFAASWNWFLNRTITFSHRQKTAKRHQWPAFLLTSSIGFTVNWGSYVLLTSYIPFFDNYRILALIIGVLLGMGLNFMTARLFVFKPFVEEIEHEHESSWDNEVNK